MKSNFRPCYLFVSFLGSAYLVSGLMLALPSHAQDSYLSCGQSATQRKDVKWTIYNLSLGYGKNAQAACDDAVKKLPLNSSMAVFESGPNGAMNSYRIKCPKCEGSGKPACRIKIDVVSGDATEKKVCRCGPDASQPLATRYSCTADIEYAQNALLSVSCTKKEDRNCFEVSDIPPAVQQTSDSKEDQEKQEMTAEGFQIHMIK